jgi:excisionase family DNA binding protein
VRFSVSLLGGTARAGTKIVDAIVRYVSRPPPRAQPIPHQAAGWRVIGTGVKDKAARTAMCGLGSGLVKVMVAQRHGGMRRDPPVHTLLTVDDVAEHLGVNVRHVRRLVQERRLRYVKWGRLLRFDPADIAAFVDEHRSTA